MRYQTFCAKWGHEIRTQDNAITAHPLFAVQQERRIYGLDPGYSDLIEVTEEGDEVRYHVEWEVVTVCFTRKGAEQYLRVNGHNLWNPRIYAMSAYRNAEMIALREWLASLPPPHHPERIMSEFPLADRSHAIDFAEGAGHVVSISGGKDSTALALLALEWGIDPALAFADTGHEHPITYEFIDRLEQHFGKPIRRVRADFSRQMEVRRVSIRAKWPEAGISRERIDRACELMRPTGSPFLDLCILKGRFPSTRARFCTQELKHFPLERQVLVPMLSDHQTVYSWQGVRAEESPSRASLPETDEEIPGLVNYRPILQWKWQDVFAMHARHGVDPNPLYRMGCGRVGCAPCIMANKSELNTLFSRFPEIVDRLEEWEGIVAEASKRGDANFFGPDKAGAIDNKGSNGMARTVAEWAKTSRGGRQYDLVVQAEADKAAKDPFTCTSKYGLCE